MDLVIREAEIKDACLLLDHIHKVGSETDNLSFGESDFNISEEKEAKFISRFKNDPNSIMLVAISDGVVVGNGIIERERIKRYSHRAELSITVLRDYWSKGIGTRLMEALVNFSKESGVHSVSLVVRADNERAKALYHKFNFSKIGVYKDYFNIKGRYYDAEFMSLTL